MVTGLKPKWEQWEQKKDGLKMYKEEIKRKLENYLRIYHGINTTKTFKCLNPEHADNNPSMMFYRDSNKLHCFSCGATYDIFDIIGIDYNLHVFPEKYKKACELFGYPVTKGKKVNKRHLQRIQREREKKKKQAYIFFCKLLVSYPPESFERNLYWTVDRNGKMKAFTKLENKIIYDLKNTWGI